MEHFSVVQSICRTGLATGSVKFRKQVERLRDRLEKSGDAGAADDLKRLLDGVQRSTELRPSVVELSLAVPGERLTSSVPPPYDRETSSPLAQIVIDPGRDTPPPVLSDELCNALDSLLKEWGDQAALESLGVTPTRSCLFFGEPGTGKTLTAMYIANRLGLPVILARLDGMMSSFLGTTARNIGTLFDFANRYKCILLLDEFDAIAKLRDDPQEVGEIKRVVNTLLQSLDVRASLGLTIAITNHPNLLDPAIWRRFEVKIEMPRPTEDQREKLISDFLRPLQVQDNALHLLSWASEGATGAEIQSMVNALKRYSVLEKEAEHRGSLESQDIVAGLRRYYVTSAKLGDRSRLALLRDEPRDLARALLASGRTSFNQSTVAQLLGKDQATISRWMRDE